MDHLLRCLGTPPAAITIRSRRFRMPGRLFYAVNHSVPFSSNGYAVRTHGVASGLVRTGLDVIAATRPGVPWSIGGFDDPGYALSHHIDGVRYVHTRTPNERGLALPSYLAQAAEAMVQLLKVFKPSAVMAASNWRNALSAALAARELGLPFFYEVRGFWEISQASRDPTWATSAAFEQEVAREAAVARAADRIFTINRFMRDELVSRGVARERIDLVPNGFPGWVERPRAATLSRADMGMTSRYVVGYIGSFNGYEGLEDLIEAAAMARRRGVDVSVLLVGSSESTGVGTGVSSACFASESYRALAQRLGMADFLFLPGRVSPDLAADYYALLDLVVIPRRPFAVCEIVSPMKPLEAAAQGKRVLMSDVAPLADLSTLCSNFSYFEKGNVASLAAKLVQLLAEPNATVAKCQALDALSWKNNVKPIVAAMARLSQRSNDIQVNSSNPQ
jgi:glycosyltransferase involved in cell wall biosynthesis